MHKILFFGLIVGLAGLVVVYYLAGVILGLVWWLMAALIMTPAGALVVPLTVYLVRLHQVRSRFADAAWYREISLLDSLLFNHLDPALCTLELPTSTTVTRRLSSTPRTFLGLTTNDKRPSSSDNHQRNNNKVQKQLLALKVGSSIVLQLRCRRANGLTHLCAPASDNVRIVVSGRNGATFEPAIDVDEHYPGSYRVSFTTSHAGLYKISARVGGYPIKNNSLMLPVEPDTLCVARTSVRNPTLWSVPVTSHGTTSSDVEDQPELRIVTRDKYGNVILPAANLVRLCLKRIEDDGTCVPVTATTRLRIENNNRHQQRDGQGDWAVAATAMTASAVAPPLPGAHSMASSGAALRMLVSLYEPGLYRGFVHMRVSTEAPWQPVSTPVTVHVLTPKEDKESSENVSRGSSVYYPVKIKGEGSRAWIYLSPTQVSVKVPRLLIFQHRIFSMRLSVNCTMTALDGPVPADRPGAPGPGLELNNCRSGTNPLRIGAPDRNVILATYLKHLHRRFGSSHSFADRKFHFQDALAKAHASHAGKRVTFTVRRGDGNDYEWLKHVIHRAKSLSDNDWRRPWRVTFEGEAGIDAGGVQRELFTLLAQRLLSPSLGLFVPVDGTVQGLLYPRPASENGSAAAAKSGGNSSLPPSPLPPIEWYRFAGRVTGKILLEQATRQSQLVVQARLARSFLAAILGLSVDHRYFEHDDPALWQTKVTYVMNASVDEDLEGLDLFFTETDVNGQETELVPGGAKIAVTTANRREYLDALAQHRLIDSVEPQIKLFLRGLNDLVKDELLCSLNESDLELLLCGVADFSPATMRKHTKIFDVNGQPGFKRTLDYFWLVLEGFAPDERCRLLQFTTGCAALPPDGFAGLRPKFQIGPAPAHTLPVARTCFNMLLLPCVDNLAELEEKLRRAITDGLEGFELA